MSSMSEFRIGRKYASHFYADPPGSGFGGGFARNYASGPASNTDATTTGSEVPWSDIASGASAGTDIPITPTVSGIIQVDGVISFANGSGINASCQVVVRVDGTGIAVPNQLQITAKAGGFASIEFSLITPAMSLNTEHQVSVFVLADVDGSMEIVADSSTIELQEVSVPTG